MFKWRILRAGFAALAIAGLALLPACRGLPYYLSNTSFSMAGTDGAMTWNQATDGSWGGTVTRPAVAISGIEGSNLTLVAMQVSLTYVSPQFGSVASNCPVDANGNCVPVVYPINSELSASGSAGFNFAIPDLESQFGIASASEPVSPSSTTSAPPLANNKGAVGEPGLFTFEVVPLWKNAFNQTNFTGSLAAGNLQLTAAAENNSVPS
ncbi:MAG: hypothetical protein KGR26_15215, partial [Cyanobacteria bacterium REEB65]|nr:hypothetical protein [Cyanobacteria bacterium REEB65]